MGCVWVLSVVMCLGGGGFSLLSFFLIGIKSEVGVLIPEQKPWEPISKIERNK